MAARTGHLVGEMNYVEFKILLFYVKLIAIGAAIGFILYCVIETVEVMTK